MTFVPVAVLHTGLSGFEALQVQFLRKTKLFYLTFEKSNIFDPNLGSNL